jgi:MFS family permease
MSFGGLVTMMSGSMIAPALPALSHDLHMSEANAGLALSIFILAFAVGPMTLAPFTEIYGRRPVWLICGAFYSVWSVVGGFSSNKGTLIASRFLSGFAASVDFVVSISSPTTWEIFCNSFFRPSSRPCSWTSAWRYSNPINWLALDFLGCSYIQWLSSSLGGFLFP